MEDCDAELRPHLLPGHMCCLFRLCPLRGAGLAAMLRFLDFFRTQAVLRARQRAARGGRHVDRGPPAEGYPDRRGGARVRPCGTLAAALQYKRVLEYLSRYGIR